MQIEVWADIVCPWCYIGDVRLRKAIAQLDDPSSVNVQTRSFQLDPFATEVPRSNLEYLSEKYAISVEDAAERDGQIGALAEAEGVPYVYPRPVANSFNLHRVTHLAREFGVGEELFYRLQYLHFGEGVDVYGNDLLTEEAAKLGVPSDRLIDLLASKEYDEDVRAEETEAREMGITGVPFTVLERKWAIPGAVGVDQYLAALEKIS